jgi:Amt family ammonium transporter
MIIGVAAGLIPFFAVVKLKGWLGYDDALDTFGVHAVGGTLGALMTGFLATSSVNANLTDANTYAKTNGLYKLVGNGLWIEQLKAIGITLMLAVVGTVVVAYIVKAVVGLRVSEEVETVGLDLAEHGEEGYHG